MQFDIDGKEMSLRPGMNTYFGKRTSRLTGRCCAILDRIIHNAYRIELAGESMRKHRMLEPST